MNNNPTLTHRPLPEPPDDSLDDAEPYSVGPVYCGPIRRGSVAWHMLRDHGVIDDDGKVLE